MTVWNPTTRRSELPNTRVIPLLEPPATPKPRTPEDEAELRRMSGNAARRRIVLLATNDVNAEIEAVLAESAAHEALGAIRQLRERYPGRRLALEWLSATGWERWFWVDGGDYAGVSGEETP